MTRDFATLKDTLWEQFEYASRRDEGIAVGTIAQALIALHREERETAEASGMSKGLKG